MSTEGLRSSDERVYCAKVRMGHGRYKNCYRRFVVRGVDSGTAWSKLEKWLQDEPFDRNDAKPFEIMQLVSVHQEITEIHDG